MKLKPLNKQSNVFFCKNATHQMVFETDEGYARAVMKLFEMYGVGRPYTNDTLRDAGHIWMFRSASCDYSAGGKHKIYLTTDEQITFCNLAFKEDD